MSYSVYEMRWIPMDIKGYKHRVVDEDVETYLQAMGALCIEGPKWCGKTWTSRYHANSEFLVGDPEGNFANRNLAELSVSAILPGDTPRLIDEWQEVPSIWDAIRYEVDKRGEKGQFIITGSSTPQRKGVLHSGAGRIARLRMRPMTLFESGKSSGSVSLRELCDGDIGTVLTGEVSLTGIIDSIIRGGWPESQDLPIDIAAKIPGQYINAVIEDDVYRIDGVQRNKRKLHLLLRSLARNESTTASNSTLVKDIKDTDSEDIDRDTVKSYLDLFDRMFLLDDQKPFAAKLRSSVRVKQAEKRHLADPSLACTLLGATKDMLLHDLETLGFLFEALCERDLRVYGDSFGATLYHYQDYSGKEIDAVLELPDGEWVAFEIKLGANQIDGAAGNLLEIKKAIHDDGGKEPKVCCVICGMSNAAYRREDGVYVIPITALRP
jgi:predicted AAA+ superfamily ATPase